MYYMPPIWNVTDITCEEYVSVSFCSDLKIPRKQEEMQQNRLDCNNRLQTENLVIISMV